MKKIRKNFLLSRRMATDLRRCARLREMTQTRLVERGLELVFGELAAARSNVFDDVPDTSFVDALPHKGRNE